MIRNPGKILTKGGDIVEGAVDMAKKDNKNDKKETKNETKEDKSNNVAIKGDCKNKKGRK